MPTAFAVFPHGVIGNTTVFGTVILGSSPGGEADFCSPLTGVFAGCGLFFHLDPFTLATFGDLRKRLTLRQNSVTKHPLKRRKDPHPAMIELLPISWTG